MSSSKEREPAAPCAEPTVPYVFVDGLTGESRPIGTVEARELLAGMAGMTSPRPPLKPVSVEAWRRAFEASCRDLERRV